ncbi:uncharacterized protein LOC143020209 [Oratosquilla oratoria]|uniref:uncharacterized protein LOC143020209 n=1 Tax=Oratosquilla oratoria TaxID=337810 RepID=UPI003F772291
MTSKITVEHCPPGTGALLDNRQFHQANHQTVRSWCHLRAVDGGLTSLPNARGSKYNAVKCYLLSKYGGNHGFRTALNHSLPTSACGQLTSNHYRQPCGHFAGRVCQAQLDRVDAA